MKKPTLFGKPVGTGKPDVEDNKALDAFGREQAPAPNAPRPT